MIKGDNSAIILVMRELLLGLVAAAWFQSFPRNRIWKRLRVGV